MTPEIASIPHVCGFEMDAGEHILTVRWSGYATTAQFRRILENQLVLMREFNLPDVFADNRGLKLIAQSDQNWMITSWLPRALEAGYRACAAIEPRDYFGRQSLAAVHERMAPHIAVNVVADEAEAFAWLRSKRGQP